MDLAAGISAARLLHWLDLLGVAVFAVSGALTAGRHRLDLLGVVVIATLTAIGGGTLRDVLLNRDRIFWIEDPGILVAILLAALATVPYVHFARPPEKSLQAADALGLALFSIAGAQVAEASGVSVLIVVVMGVITGVAGGVMRDVLCNEVPMILRKGNLYAAAAISGLVVYVLLRDTALPRPWPSVAGMSVIVGVRACAIIFNWSLPEFRLATRPRD